MYQAAIVEDEKDVRNYLKAQLANSFSSLGTEVDFDLFASGDEFLDSFEDHIHYDMIFLDIEMPGLDGLSVCRRIRRMQEDVPVIFIYRLPPSVDRYSAKLYNKATVTCPSDGCCFSPLWMTGMIVL